MSESITKLRQKIVELESELTCERAANHILLDRLLKAQMESKQFAEAILLAHKVAGDKPEPKHEKDFDEEE